MVSEIKTYRTYLIEWFLLNEKFNTGWFFPYLIDSEKNTPITSWSQRMKKVFKACDIANSLHGLRHTHASNLLMKGFPLIQVANSGRVWFIVTVLKTVVPSSAPWVRIPLPPPLYEQKL